MYLRRQKKGRRKGLRKRKPQANGGTFSNKFTTVLGGEAAH
ncbi:hypothetical protein [Ruegeria sp. Ofav3-42]|nr:hypothetical protein [Ruegeria sp. Ofav3-42]